MEYILVRMKKMQRITTMLCLWCKVYIGPLSTIQINGDHCLWCYFFCSRVCCSDFAMFVPYKSVYSAAVMIITYNVIMIHEIFLMQITQFPFYLWRRVTSHCMKFNTYRSQNGLYSKYIAINLYHVLDISQKNLPTASGTLLLWLSISEYLPSPFIYHVNLFD